MYVDRDEKIIVPHHSNHHDHEVHFVLDGHKHELICLNNGRSN